MIMTFGLVTTLIAWILAIGYVAIGHQQLGIDKKQYIRESVYRVVMCVALSVLWGCTLLGG